MRVRGGHIQARWIWVTVYTIAGALALTHLAFLLFDALPSGIFYAGFGFSSLVGAALANRQSRGGRLVEGIIAAVVIGLLQLSILVLNSPAYELGAIEKLRAPLSTTIVCFAGAVAGGRLGARWHLRSGNSSPSTMHLTAMAVLLLIGTQATHTLILVVLEHFFLAKGPLVALAIIMFIGAPAMAGMSLQLVAKRDVTGPLARAAVVIGLVALALINIKEGPDLALMIGGGIGLFFGGLIATGLAALGAVGVRRWEPDFEAPRSMPEAVVHSDAAP